MSSTICPFNVTTSKENLTDRVALAVDWLRPLGACRQAAVQCCLDWLIPRYVQAIEQRTFTVDVGAALIVADKGDATRSDPPCPADLAADPRTLRDFDNNRWYHIRLRVARDTIRAWIGEDQIVDLFIDNHWLSVQVEMLCGSSRLAFVPGEPKRCCEISGCNILYEKEE